MASDSERVWSGTHPIRNASDPDRVLSWTPWSWTRLVQNTSDPEHVWTWGKSIRVFHSRVIPKTQQQQKCKIHWKTRKKVQWCHRRPKQSIHHTTMHHATLWLDRSKGLYSEKSETPFLLSRNQKLTDFPPPLIYYGSIPNFLFVTFISPPPFSQQ